MPLVSIKDIEDGALLGIWRVEEKLETLKEGLAFTTVEKGLYKTFANEKRQQEWLAARQLLKSMVGRPLPLEYNAVGKPVPKDGSFEISLSHSHGWVAAIIHPQLACGLDIQLLRPKIYKIRDKFLSDPEKEFCGVEDLELLHILWGAKEALFKWFGGGGIDFKEHLRIQPFSLEEQGIIHGSIQHPRGSKILRLAYEKIADTMLVYVLNN